MKKMAMTSKKALALLLALMMLCMGSVITAFAVDPTVKLTISGDEYNRVIIASAVVTGGEEGAKATISISPSASKSVMEGNTVFSNLDYGTEYTITATYGDATDTETFKTADEPVISFTKNINYETGVITVVASLKGFEDGTKPVFTVTANPEKTVDSKAEDFTLTINNFDFNTSYTVAAKATLKETEITNSVVVTPKHKNDQIPDIKVTTTATTALINPVTGAEYKCDDGEWQSNNNFVDLTPETFHTFCIRYAENEQYRAGDEKKITIKTLKQNSDKATAPVIDEVSQVSITVRVNLAGCEYSKDNGKNWQTSNVFTGLTSGETYYICRRFAGEPGVKECGPASESVAVKTNTGDVFTASISNCKVEITSAEPHYAKQEVELKATGDGRTTGTPQWGDTRLVAMAVKAKTGSETVTAAFDKNVAKFVPTVNGECSVTVVFEKDIYKGEEEGWVYADQVNKTEVITIAKEYNALTGFLQKIISLVTNTIPQLFYNLFHLIRNFDLDGIVGKITG